MEELKKNLKSISKNLRIIEIEIIIGCWVFGFLAGFLLAKMLR